MLKKIRVRKELRPGSTAIMWHVTVPWADGHTDFWAYDFKDASHYAGRRADRLTEIAKHNYQNSR